jgi:hypothetical protein
MQGEEKKARLESRSAPLCCPLPRNFAFRQSSVARRSLSVIVVAAFRSSWQGFFRVNSNRGRNSSTSTSIVTLWPIDPKEHRRFHELGLWPKHKTEVVLHQGRPYLIFKHENGEETSTPWERNRCDIIICTRANIVRRVFENFHGLPLSPSFFVFSLFPVGYWQYCLGGVLQGLLRFGSGLGLRRCAQRWSSLWLWLWHWLHRWL